VAPGSSTITRRELVRRGGTVTAALAAGPALLSACGDDDDGGAGGDSERLVVGTFGGTFGESFTKHVVRPFEKETGIRVVQDNAFTQWFSRIRINPSNPPIDVGIFGDVDVERGRKQGLWAKLDPESMPNVKKLGRFDIGSPYGFPYAYAMLGLVVNTDKVKEPPTSVAQIFEEPYSSMRIGMPGLPNTFGYSWLVKIAELKGGGVDNLEPAFDALKEINLQYAAADFVRAYDDTCAGNLDLLLWVSDYTLTVQERGCAAHFIVPDDGGILVVNELTVPKGSKRIEQAQQFIDFFLGVEPQEAFAVEQRIGPVNEDAQPQWRGKTGEQAAELYTAEAVKAASYYQPRDLLPNLDSVTEQFKATIQT
jgi:putative spermidine/putrescine transport system substrate-binding protein